MLVVIPDDSRRYFMSEFYLVEVLVLGIAYGVWAKGLIIWRQITQTCFGHVIACMVYWACLSILYGVSWGFRCIIRRTIIN